MGAGTAEGRAIRVTTPPEPIIAYLRFSTSQQGRSGLGIETQREAIARFAAVEGFQIAAEHAALGSGHESELYASFARTNRQRLLYRSSHDDFGLCVCLNFSFGPMAAVIDGILGINTRRYLNTYIGATPHEDIDAATDDSQTEPNRMRLVGLRWKTTWKDLQHA